MKLVRARIQNFRSVEDSEEFSLDEHITCLVGKNESGKTTLLTALYRLSPIFNDAKFDRQKDYPRRHLSDYEERYDGKDANVITTWWGIDPAEKQTIIDTLGAGALKSDEVVVQKDYGNRICWTVNFDDVAPVPDDTCAASAPANRGAHRRIGAAASSGHHAGGGPG